MIRTGATNRLKYVGIGDVLGDDFDVANLDAAVMFDESGTISGRGGGYWTPIQPYLANTWYTISLVIDPAAGTYIPIIDGFSYNPYVLKGTNLIKTFEGYTETATNTTGIWIDDISITEEDAPVGGNPSLLLAYNGGLM
jgi:hypothetical protein